ncbi:MAG: nucleotide pyrophosphohydrolase [Pirellulaceae bacterium]|nr:nucleotide pyrophosphohydrolase [Pirellulaceae bacterium]
MSDSYADDEATSLADLKRIVAEFVAERDWQQFHSPKNLSMAMAIEVAELMEHFQWISMDESRSIPKASGKQRDIAEEMSDVFCYLLAMANEMQIDLSSSLQQKMVKNREKYPSDVFQGRYGAEDLERD